jgi:hypothetical protein
MQKLKQTNILYRSIICGLIVLGLVNLSDFLKRKSVNTSLQNVNGEASLNLSYDRIYSYSWILVILVIGCAFLPEIASIFYRIKETLIPKKLDDNEQK